MKKKFTAKAASAVLAGVMAVSVVACGSTSSNADTATSSTDTNASSEQTIAETQTEDAATQASAGEVAVPEGSIELDYNLTTDDYATFQQIIADFTKETGIQVTINNLGGDYESAMKTKMASNDLPDMWVTHGWSLIRYSEYMRGFVHICG